MVAILPADADGAAAEYVAAPAGVLAAAPRTVELADAAALPLAGLTAWQALFEHSDLKPGQRILVNGGGGGVGRYAAQLANRAGADVTATPQPAQPRPRPFPRRGSRRRLHQYATARGGAGQRFDVVLHLVRDSPEQTARLVDLVADGGVLVSTTTPGADNTVRGVRSERVFVRNDAAQLAELVALVDAGDLTIDVAERRPLADLAAVHEEALAGKLPGKTIRTP